MMRRGRWGRVLGAAAGAVLALAASTGAATYTVDSNEDTGTTSLRGCIAAANLNPGMDSIVFAISNSITLHSGIMITDPVDIDGGGTQVVGQTSGSYIFFLGSGSAGSVIRNLALVDSGDGIVINSDDNQILNCRVGTDWADSFGRGNNEGIYLCGAIQGNAIGLPGWGNVISGNASFGIISDTGVSRTLIQGNLIGLTSDGNTAMANGFSGIYLLNNRETLIGGNRDSGQGNVISGNNYNGVVLDACVSAGNTLCGNIIGLQADQTDTVANGDVGVLLKTSTGNQIGLPQAGYENIICGSTYGIATDGTAPRPTLNLIQNNWVGLNSAGQAHPNACGLYLADADGNVIGGNRGAGLYERNILSGNTSFGIWSNGSNNVVSGNYIGLAADGATALPNHVGIALLGGNNRLGGSNIDAANLFGNVISGNSLFGVDLEGPGNTLAGNYIGLNAAGTAACANQHGLLVSGPLASGNVIGLGSSVGRNVISGNTQDGLRIEGASRQNVLGNYLGTSADGLSVVPNGRYPVFLQSAAQCLFGGEADKRNLLCGQAGGYPGIYGYMAETAGNTIAGNWFNLLADGSQASPALQYGITLFLNAHDNSIGLKSTGFGNLIVGVDLGVGLSGAGNGNGFYGNTICSFTNPATGVGIALSGGANNDKAMPVISAADAAEISGTSAAGDYIQVFRTDRGAGFAGGSLQRVGTAVADGSGNWSLVPGGLVYGDHVCALASDAANNTSVFTTNMAVTGLIPPTATLTMTPTATSTATPTATPTMTPAAAAPSPTVTPTATSTATSTPTAIRTLESSAALLAVPNPATEQVRFLVRAAQSGEAVLDIYNFNGERVAEIKGVVPAGGSELRWNCTGVAAGIYLARLKINGERTALIKVAIMK